MIIDSPILSVLPVGTERVIPQEGDAQVVLPNVITPVLEPLLPGAIRGNGVTLTQESAFVSIAATRAPSTAASSVTIAVLGKGLWEIEINLAGRFDYLGTGATPEMTVQMFDGATGTFVLNMYAAIGVQSVNKTFRYLSTSSLTLRLSFGATNAGETINSSIGTVIRRIL